MLSQILDRTNNIFEWSNTAKSQFIYFFSAILCLYGATIVLLVFRYTQNSGIDVLSPYGVVQAVRGSAAYCAICLSMGFLGIFLQRRHLDIPIYTHICLHLYTLGNVFFLYFFGVFNVIAGVAMAGGVVIGLIMFTKRLVFPSFFFGVFGALAIFGLSYFGFVPYAAVLTDPTAKDANLWWSILTAAVAVPHVASLIYLTIVCVDRWVEREQKVNLLSMVDSLTDCYNRRYFLEEASHKLEECQQEQQNVALIILDIDHFKRINDNYNYQVGDHIITVIASYVLDAARRQDIVCRYGGEEFCIFLPNCDVFTAKLIAERCRIHIQYRPITADSESLPITASFGIVHAAYNADCTPNLTTLIAQADQALYKAKKTGRNKCVTVAYNPNANLLVSALA